MREVIARQMHAIARKVIEIGEKAPQLAEELSKAGFSACAAQQRFAESFANNKHDLALHRRFVVENAKARLTRLPPLTEVSYISPFLNELKKSAMVSPLLGDAETAWIPRLHIDPCEQNSLVLQVRHRDEYERRERAMKEQQANQLRIESARHSSGLRKRYPLGMLVKTSRFNFAENVMRREFGRLGFAPAGGKASRGRVIMKKSLGSEWGLTWSLAELDLFYYTPTEGAFVPILALRSESKQPREYQDGTFVLRYSSLIEGFSTTYLRFHDLDSLEMHIMAHAKLYELIAEDVESAILSE